MIVYSFFGGDQWVFATLAEAVKAARETAADPGWDRDIEVERHELVPLTKPNIIAIINGGGGSWSAGCETVKVIRCKNS